MKAGKFPAVSYVCMVFIVASVEITILDIEITLVKVGQLGTENNCITQTKRQTDRQALSKFICRLDLKLNMVLH